MQTSRTDLWQDTQQGKERVGRTERLAVIYIYTTMCEIDSWLEAAVQCSDDLGWGAMERWEGGSRGRVYMYA